MQEIAAAKTALGVELKAKVPVKFMGLWDTVEALGWPDYEENVDEPNSRYADQLCNVMQARHAVSLDDNRSRIFTPILLTRKHLVEHCENVDLKGSGWKQMINGKVQEVWFAGAHADVGGGYEDGAGQLSGVSLNWMMAEARANGLPLSAVDDGKKFPIPAPQAPMANTHDAENELWYLYHRRYRNIDAYVASPNSSVDRLKFHTCLVKHIEARPKSFAEYGGQDPVARALLDQVGNNGLFKSCFPDDGGRFRFSPDAPGCDGRIEVVSTREPLAAPCD